MGMRENKKVTSLQSSKNALLDDHLFDIPNSKNRLLSKSKSAKNIEKFEIDEKETNIGNITLNIGHIIKIQRKWKEVYNRCRYDQFSPFQNSNQNNNQNKVLNIYDKKEGNENANSLNNYLRTKSNITDFSKEPTNNYKKKSTNLLSSKNTMTVKRSRYMGQRNSINNNKEGFGILKWEDKTKYIGFFKNDKAHGLGKLRHIDGFYYKGEFKEDKASGYGLFTGASGAEYEGYWENDTQNGIGREVLTNSHTFNGVFSGGKKTGIGKRAYIILHIF